GREWRDICAFLDQPIPRTPFPRSNKSGTIEAEAQRHAVGVFGTARNAYDRFNRNALIVLQKLFGEPIP
ncbi:MAG: sulfotransferase, partial [Pseudomonadota bacterium]